MAFTPLNALTEFLVVARRRSFAAAAAELGVSPSALSQAVLKLEERLGVSLLARTTRSVALTDAGRRLYEEAAPAVAQAVAALKSTSAKSGELTGRVRLSVPELAVPHVITPVLPVLLARHPHIDVEIQVEDRLIDIIDQGFDAGVRLEEFLERDMVHVRLTAPFRFVVAGAPSYLKRRGVPQKPQDLLTHDCLCYRSPTTGIVYPWELERGKKLWRIPVRGPLTTNDVNIRLAMAEAGHGLTYAFEPGIQKQLQRGSLRLVLEPFAATVPGLFLYFPNRAQISPAFRAFVDVAREVIAKPLTKDPERVL